MLFRSWIVPLAMYLLSFILAFGRRFRISPARMSRIIPMTLLVTFPIVAAGVSGGRGYNWIFISVHLLILSSGALLCHTALSQTRPDTRHLTEFYFWIAVGGVLGGVFTAMIAPILFIGSLFDLVFTLTDMTVVYLLTVGGPANSTHVLSSYAFLVGIQSGALGRGAAIALLLFPILLIIVFFVLRALTRRDI